MPFIVIAVVGSAAILFNAFAGTVPGYRVAPAFLIPLLLAVYALRRKLNLSPTGYALFTSAILLHDLGAYGFYQQNPTGISFDIFVHGWFGFVGAWLIRAAIAPHLPWQAWQVSLLALFILMGFGGLHEVMEYGTYLALGEERGMLKKTSYRFDTERDLLSNLCGGLAALACASGVRSSKPPTRL